MRRLEGSAWTENCIVPGLHLLELLLLRRRTTTVMMMIKLNFKAIKSHIILICHIVISGYQLSYSGVILSFLHSHCSHKDHHHEHGCMRVDAGLARHQSLSRNLVNPCLSRYIPLHYNPLHYIALHLPCATITCTNLRYISPATITCTTLRYISPVLQYAAFPCTTFSCATKHTASLQLRKLGYRIAGSRHNTWLNPSSS